ncbi:pre-mRNA-processing factor 6, putative [Plasmodium knowlesi strain H]|uniref:Pre-mRNA-processing factor 6, putative n=3 Tax=Plasmodium knowlesi TaxID=5850 RepID=A0A5K1UXR1_PLAKH|nr:pre-mRNA-processing factor 6, putative [Plasmodium knowlesi strain H]OTN65088.1 putative PRP1 splicing factor [Plasmodium knowlesi]CAA9988126.1 pre-mRNA-processing factor 6, putative [Plasmodium knowlesi strain H]SBO20008.1 pre-mRNA-processing factor 6, putative [Plasmodium knowlesi strain H]SBO20823.1 pre-mRNA-processing factor 6, putative [Plasmodium knowlesi strain H]VVS77600.1 pre-mRNA-processing factor 6, putative [Plasmodium knowlesi strain H]|eukprot:XP_002259102.1 PRP1 splicing factor, putative [Plasmodium knowlesi strain H]
MRSNKNDMYTFNAGKVEPFGKAPVGYIPGKGRGVTGFSGGVSRDDTTDEKDKNDYSDFNYDEFHGYSESLFKDAEYDEDDKEADAIYENIDARMDVRRKSRREIKLKEEIQKIRAQKPTIQEQFSDLKKGLASVTAEEWESIPTVMNYSRQKQKKVPKNYLPTPDSLIMSRLNDANMHLNYSSSSSNGLKTPLIGMRTPLGTQTPVGTQTPLGRQNSLGIQTPLGLRTPLGASTPIGLGMQTPFMKGGGFGLETPFLSRHLLTAKGKSASSSTYSGLNTPFTLSGYNTPLSASTAGGYNTPLMNGVNKLSLNDVGEARGTVLSVKLDELIDSVEGQTVIDPKGYLTNLNAKSLVNDADIADINKARSLLKSVISTNPKHGPGWIAAARVEELAQRKDKAKEIITKGCIECSKNEDIWLEAVRLEDKLSEVKIILTKGIKEIPTSVKLWLEAYRKESNIDDKRKVLRKAIECIPNSVRLWKEAISLESENNAYILLKRAVECIPQCIEMWIALARLCPYTEAQKVLNEARKKIPTSAEIWINASKLEEKQGNNNMVDIIIKRCIENLSSKNVVFERDKWLKFAEESEKSDFPLTCESIIKNTMNIGVESLNKKRIYKQDAENCIKNKSIHTARAIYNEALKIFKTKKSLWLALANLELAYGNKESVEQVLQRAVKSCPHSSVLWLMYAKQKWLNNEIDKAREILAESFMHNQNTEVISLAAIKLERENNEFDRARFLLKKSRVQCNTPKIWMQSIQLERLLRNYKDAKELAQEALQIHKRFDKLYMIAGQIELEMMRAEMDCLGGDSGPIHDNEVHTASCASTILSSNHSRIGSNARSVRNDTSSEGGHGEEQQQEEDTQEEQAHTSNACNPNEHYTTAQKIYDEGLKHCPSSINLWLCAIDLQIEKKNYTSARALVEKAKIKIKNIHATNTNNYVLKNKEIIESNEFALDDELNRNDEEDTKSGTNVSNLTNTKNDLSKNAAMNASIRVIENYDLLWIKLIEIESLCNSNNITPVISEALKECPSSGILWSKAIEFENKNLQNSKSVTAFNNCGNNAYVILTVAKLFWQHFKTQKARKWFYRVISLNPNFGDGWATFLAFEIDQQNEVNQKDIINKCIKAEPNRGYMWNKITKRVENWRLKYPQKLYKYIKELFPEVLKKKISEQILEIMSDENVSLPVSAPKSEVEVPETVESTDEAKAGEANQTDHPADDKTVSAKKGKVKSTEKKTNKRRGTNEEGEEPEKSDRRKRKK